jgi:hypothetical protein
LIWIICVVDLENADSGFQKNVIDFPRAKMQQSSGISCRGNAVARPSQAIHSSSQATCQPKPEAIQTVNAEAIWTASSLTRLAMTKVKQWNSLSAAA